MHNRLTATLGLGLLVLGTGCPGRDPFKDRRAKIVEPAAGPVLGSVIEKQFEPFLRACAVLDVLKLKNKTAIPDRLVEEPALPMDAHVVYIPETSGRRLFRLLASASDLNEYPELASRADSRSLLNAEFFGEEFFPILRPDKDASNVGFTHSCSTYVGADLAGSVEPPNAAVQAALKTEQNRQVRLVIASGFFQSPLQYFIEQGGTARFYANLGIFDVYTRNTELRSGGKYLTGFRGVLVFRSDNATDSTKFSFSANGTTAIPLASGSFKSRAGFDLSSSFDASDFGTAIYLEKPGAPSAQRPSSTLISSSYLADLPSVTSIQALAKSIKPIESSPAGSSKVLGQRASFEHWNEYIGVPASICGSSWNLVKTGGTLDLNDVNITTEPHNDYKVPSCRFTVKATPDGAAFSAGSKSDTGEISYEFQTKINGLDLAFSSRRTFNLTAGPLPIVPNDSLTPTWRFRDDGRAPLLWDFKLQFDERGSPIDWARASQIKVTLKGAGSSGQVRQIAVPQVHCIAAEQACNVAIHPLAPEFISDKELTSLTYEFLQFTGTVSAPVGASGIVERPVNVVIKWPTRTPPASEILPRPATSDPARQ